jgi:putative addiction module component (TIGR02574 family)
MMLGGEIIMSERTAQLLQEVLALDLQERIDVASRLDQSIQSELPEWPHETDEDEEHAELLRRLATVEDGSAELIPFEEAMSRIASELDRRQKARDAAKP